ncbi:MAG: hypothetical protein COA52_15860 [Hyphomicrobiales bacterium]|nr:FAD binding domain-containing protein [Hyphomicrobiales bacterium]PCJ85701.1 MAG: hypothetical protein COA52_15860 [Hyphomicrobiales bacterium]
MLEEIHLPSEVTDAVDLLSSRKSIGVLAGGTLVMGEYNTRPSDLLEMVSLSQMDDAIRGIQVDGDTITIGAATPLCDLEADDALSFLHSALESIGSPTLRNMATVGGNFFAQNGYGDLATCFIALSATCTLAGANGERTVDAENVVQGAKPDELLVSIAFKKPAPGSWRYRKAMRRKANAVSIATVAALIELDAGVIKSARVAIGGASSVPARAPSVEKALLGQPLDLASATSAGEAAKKDVHTYSDAHASAWYRERVLPVHVRRTLIGR